MHLSYYLVVLVLPLYIAQVTVSNENDQPVQLGLRNDGKIRTIANGSKTNKKWFKYIECGKEFSCAGNLKRPKVMMHTEDDDAYKCKICSKVFNAPSILTRHNLVHEEKRPFKCNTCDKGFKYRYCLSAHMVTHTDEKTQKCNVCGKEFKHIRSLQRHKFTHGNVRFQCKECGRNFTQKVSLNRHMKMHKSSSEKLYSVLSSLMISIADDIIDTEIFIMEIITFAGL